MTFEKYVDKFEKTSTALVLPYLNVLAPLSRITLCRILKETTISVKPIARPTLNKNHKEKCIAWAKKYMKINFQNVIFMDEARAALDGPDGWDKIWIPLGASRLHRIRYQQGGGFVIFWAGIIKNELLGTFRMSVIPTLYFWRRIFQHRLNDLLLPRKLALILCMTILYRI